MQSSIITATGVDAHQAVALSADSDQSASANGESKPIYVGDFIDKAKARNMLVEHLQKLLAFFSQLPEIDDPGDIGYVTQTFQVLLPLNPIEMPESGELDEELKPISQYSLYEYEGSWPELDEVVGLDHDQHRVYILGQLDRFSRKDGAQ